MLHKRERSTIQVLLWFTVGAGCVGAQTCPALTDEVRSRVAAYVADRYEVAPDLKVEDGGVADGSCFRRVGIRVSAPQRSLELFLSPDQRFLFETLLDMNISPAAERRRVARQTQLALSADVSPFQGPPNAPVTLVVFSDLQCPFCRRFANILTDLPAADRQMVKILFKHRPLVMHAWARQASLASICASLESNDSFWRLEEFLFSNQTAIAATNLEDKIAAFAKESGGIDFARMHECLMEGGGEETLLRDEKLAGLYHIDVVPTVFINGRRNVAIRSVEELQGLLRAARADSPTGPGAEPGLGSR